MTVAIQSIKSWLVCPSSLQPGCGSAGLSAGLMAWDVLVNEDILSRVMGEVGRPSTRIDKE